MKILLLVLTVTASILLTVNIATTTSTNKAEQNISPMSHVDPGTGGGG